jgi:uncharacterized membrane protein
VALGLLVFLLLPISLVRSEITRGIVAWNVGAILYLILAARMMLVSSTEKIKSRALLEDEGRVLVLIFVILAAACTLTTIVAELSFAKNLAGATKFEHIALAGLTIATSWFFTHVMFAIHYAHDYFAAISHRQPGGLEFPGVDKLNYGDFVYLAFVIGTSGQTADVSFSSRNMRRTGTVHCVLSFVFNTTLLALTINIASGLF